MRRFGQHGLLVLVFVALPWIASRDFGLNLALGKAAARPGHAAPVPVRPFRARYCGGFGPGGWFVLAENAQRVAFGADFESGDGLAYASYSVFSAGPMSPVPGSQSIDAALTSALTLGGRMHVLSSRQTQTGLDTFLIEYVTDANHGVAFYRIVPAGRGLWIIVMRIAGTGPRLWGQRGSEAVAVARSLRCQVPNVADHPPPATRAEAKRSTTGEKGDDDPLYNHWLDKEYYHNPKTGENFWVSPSEDWVKDGPAGPGYYAPHGNTVMKLDPGYAE